MEEIKELIREVLLTIGGSTAITIILLKVFKERIEKWVDTNIELKSSKSLAKFEASLEKKKKYSEEKVKNELNAFSIAIDIYDSIWTNYITCCSLIDEQISKKKLETSTLNFYPDFKNAINHIKEYNNKFLCNDVKFRIYLPNKTYDLIRTSSEKIKEWYDLIDVSIALYNIEINSKDELLAKTYALKNYINNSLDMIKKEFESRAV